MAEFQALDRVSGIEYKRHGYLFLLTNEVDVESFQTALALQQNLGVPSGLISPDDVKAMIPALETSDLLAAAFCPIDGHASPETVVQAYAGAAAAQGVQIIQGTSLDRIAVLGDKIVTIETSAGRIRTPTVICTAGVWSKDVGNLAGLDIPVRGEARWMHFTPEDGGLPPELPLTVDFSTGFYFHREGAGLVFGGREPTIEGVASHGTRRLPVLAELPIQSSWWGFYEMSPDHNAIVGEGAQPRRFLYATGFSGQGFQQAPAVGEHLAELVVGEDPTLDLSPLSLDRFARGGERHERFVV
jgi:sarcosine oxidase subunit beta